MMLLGAVVLLVSVWQYSVSLFYLYRYFCALLQDNKKIETLTSSHICLSSIGVQLLFVSSSNSIPEDEAMATDTKIRDIICLRGSAQLIQEFFRKLMVFCIFAF